MADLAQLERALVKADAAGDADAARAFASEIKKMRGTPKQEGGVLQDLGNWAAGGLRGAGSIGATLVAPYDMAKDALNGKGLSLDSNRQRRADMDSALSNLGADTNSGLYNMGKLASEIGGTMGVGPALGAVAGGLGAAPSVVNALATGGMRAGATPGALNMLTRIGGGAVTGGVSAGLIDPDQAKAGAIVGSLMPPALTAAGAVGNYVGRNVNALVQPFTEKGQQAIANKVVSKFAEGGPTAMNAKELVPGSLPTLAEATGNPGIARLQSVTSDVRPNAFAERQASNAAARSAALDDLAGDAGKLDFFKADRSQVAGDLYKSALDQANAAEATPYVKGQITQLLKRPSINEASKAAQKLALERGEKPAAEGSLRALHDVKTALDDKISVAVREGRGGEAAALQDTKDKLVGVMDKLSDGYAQARSTYAEMSKPVNQMEVLQGLKLADAKGNITLAKIQNALDGLQRKMNGPGIDPAKSLTADQVNVLKAIRDDLLRQSNLNAGKSAGSNTLQNIATDNMLTTLVPGRLGGVLTNKAGGLVGQIGKLAYSGPNEAIRNKLANMMLDPALAEQAFLPQMNQLSGFRTGLNALQDRAAQGVYLAAPAVTANR